LEANWWI